MLAEGDGSEHLPLQEMKGKNAFDSLANFFFSHKQAKNTSSVFPTLTEV